MMPLLLLGAICVELVALRLDSRYKPVLFGAVGGFLCGTVGFAGEYAWSQVSFPLPWTEALIPEALICAAIAGVAGGMLGGLLASGLRAELPPTRVARTACIGAFVLLLGVGINAGIRDLPDANASFVMKTVDPEPKRTALATVKVDPPDAAEGANWFYILAWQGGPGTKRVVDRLEKIGPGTYRSTKPIPLYGRWKSGLRLHTGRARGAAPIRLPADDALDGSNEVLPATFTRELAEDADPRVGRCRVAGSCHLQPAVPGGRHDRAARVQGRRAGLALGVGDRADRWLLRAVHHRHLGRRGAHDTP